MHVKHTIPENLIIIKTLPFVRGAAAPTRDVGSVAVKRPSMNDPRRGRIIPTGAERGDERFGVLRELLRSRRAVRPCVPTKGAYRVVGAEAVDMPRPRHGHFRTP
jgi:hypothetical protein